MANATAEVTTAQSSSRRWINHSSAEVLWKYEREFASMSFRLFEKNPSSCLKALIVVTPAIDSARWLANREVVMPFNRLSSLAEAK